jgi:uncharacterized RDD family membrane protein YckC
MKCTVCQRDLAPDWSVCPKCGAMKNDSVREELESSLTPLTGPIKYQFNTRSVVGHQPKAAAEPVEKKPIEKRVETADLRPKKTSPTLAEFKTPNMTIPDWRLQLQNSVRQRNGRVDAVSSTSVPPPTQTSGANALKARYVEEPAPEPSPELKDLKVANALKRIEQSRRTYLPTEKAREGIRVAKEASKNFPFNVVSRTENAPERPAVAPAEAPATRPKLVSSMKIEKKPYDTNKLVPIPAAAEMAARTADTEHDTEAGPKPALKANWSQKFEIRESASLDDTAIVEPAEVEDFEPETDEIDDLAPISMRFNAGLFDLVIGVFASCILLSPVLASSEVWFSLSGVLIFLGVLLAVMFVYQTASVAYMGQTFGMKLFSLELVDAEQSEYPTLQQAAVNSSIYLLSLVFGGLGFVPILLNEEKRAAHDLVSGTILVREV